MKKIIFSIFMLLVPAILWAGCTSDFDCGFGQKCVKAPYSMSGQCMEEVDRYGTKQYNPPNTNSFGTKSEGSCRFDTDCPIGFSCDRN